MGTPYECGMDGTTQNDSQRCVYQAWGYSKKKYFNSCLYTLNIVAFSIFCFTFFSVQENHIWNFNFMMCNVLYKFIELIIFIAITFIFVEKMFI